jgi:hypothetical protein
MSVEIFAELKALKINVRVRCHPALSAEARRYEFAPYGFRKQLIEVETAERTVRSMA